MFRHLPLNSTRSEFKNLKLRLKIILLLIPLFLVNSCSKFLTEDLKGEFSSDTFYQNEIQALQALNGTYNALTFRNFNNAMWVFGDIASDDAVKGGGAGDQSEITYIDKFSADANNGVAYNYWSFCYEAIARANNVIAKVPAVPMDDSLKSRIIGEAKFIRAYSYFNLVNVFGKVPLKLLPQISQETINVPLSEIPDIFKQIETDLSSAANALPVSYSLADQGRITRGAALAMLCKVNLYQQKWAAVIIYFQRVELLGIYDLLPNYADNFKLEYQNSTESIFWIQHLSGQNPYLGNGLNQWFAPAPGGYYFNAPTQNLVNAFEKSTSGDVDPRLDATIGREGQPWLNGENFSAAWSPATGYLTKKHQQPLSEVTSAMKEDGGLNYIYLRYADLLLMAAEAFNENNDAVSARENLNRVRERARESFNGTPPDDLLADITTSDKNLLREAIHKERRVELGQEFHRYFDLIRWGESVATAALGPDFTWSKRFIPIPQKEIDANQALKP